MNCIDYGSEALNKVYAGLNCQVHSRELPFTGSELFWYGLVGTALLLVGYALRKEREN